MGKERLENAAPVIHEVKDRKRVLTARDLDASIEDPVDATEVFDHIRDICDPEHPYTLEQLNVVEVWAHFHLQPLPILGRAHQSPNGPRRKTMDGRPIHTNHTPLFDGYAHRLGNQG